MTAPLVLELQGTAPTPAASLPCDYCGEGRGAPVYDRLRDSPNACPDCMALPTKARVKLYYDRLIRISGKSDRTDP